MQSILIGLLGFQIVALIPALPILTFPKASPLIHWESHIQSALWERELSPRTTEVLRNNDGVRTNLCLTEWGHLLSHSVFLLRSKDKFILQGFRYLAISVTGKTSREEFTAETLLFLSPMPVTEVVVIFMSLAFETETEAERGPLTSHRGQVCKP